MAIYDNSKVILKGTWDLASGLTNGQTYCLLPGGAFLAIGNPLAINSGLTIAQAGARDGNGLYRLPPGARHLFWGLATLNAMTGAVSCTTALFPSYAQPWLPRTAAFGNPAPVALSNGFTAGLLYPAVPGSVLTAAGGSGSLAPEWFLPVVSAATWPSSSGLLDLILAAY